MARNAKKSDKKDKGAKRKKREKRSQLAPALTSVQVLPRSAPVALAVAAGALFVAGLTSLWRIRR